MTPLKQVALIILDGWGYTKETKHNAIYEADPQYFNSLWNDYPHTLFQASGESVGLPEGIIGTSEIGHTIIGSGQIIDTDIVSIFKSIKNNELKDRPVILELLKHVKDNNSTLHLMGLLSPGGVHSHQEHLFALIKIAKESGISNIVVHVFTDGRDKPPQSAVEYVKELEGVLHSEGVGKVGTISGRYYAMDRDNNWDRIERTEQAIFEGKGTQYTDVPASSIVEEEYKKSTNDEFISPCVLLDNSGQASTISQNDGVLFYNFRPDRARQLSEAISKKANEMNLYFATMTEYAPGITPHIVFPVKVISTTLSEEVAKAGMSQVHIAETEKYAHVTYFLNGGSETKHNSEEFVLVESRKDVPTHDLAPEMKAKEITDKALEYIKRGTQFLAINFANADMVGHTGKMEPTIVAIKTIDEQLKRLVPAILENGGAVFITADHGNAEVMFDESTNQPQTAHTLNPVPGILTIENIKIRQEGTLADVAPTILALFGHQKPKDMTGNSLIVE